MPRLSEQENYIRTKRGHRGGDSGGNVAEAQQQQQQLPIALSDWGFVFWC